MPRVGLDAKEMMNKVWPLPCGPENLLGDGKLVRASQYREMKHGRGRPHLVFSGMTREGSLVEAMSKLRPPTGGHTRASQAQGRDERAFGQRDILCGDDLSGVHPGDYQAGKVLGRWARATVRGAHGQAEELGPHSGGSRGQLQCSK